MDLSGGRRTGFRLAYGGAQEIFGLIPDLVVYGKAIGGGLPLGAVAGRSDVMAVSHNDQVVNPLSVTAGTATLDYLFANRATLYPALNDAARGLAEHFNAFAVSEGLPVEMRSAGSMFHINFTAAETVAANAFNVLALSRGVLLLPCHKGYLSTAHTGADLDIVRDALTHSLRDLRDDGLLTRAS